MSPPPEPVTAPDRTSTPVAAPGGPNHTRHRRVAVVGAVIVVALVVLAALTAVRARAEPLPTPVATRTGTLATTVPGTPVPLPWPAGGEAALVTASGVALGSSGPLEAVPIASVTKVMTAYVVLRDYPLGLTQSGPSLTITRAEAANLPARLQEGQSILPVHAGERLTERQALQALLIPSANNIAAVLARFDAGTTTAFTAKMNATAHSLGLAHTHYAGPSGYNPASTSTAADQLILARAALALPALGAIVAEPTATLPGVGVTRNYNTLAGHDGYRGIKTGSTAAAGGCLLYAVTRTVAGTPVTLFGAVLGQRGGPYITAAINAARTLTDAAFAGFHPRTVLAAGTQILAIHQAGQYAAATTTAGLVTVDPPGTPITLRVTTMALPATIPPGTPVATVTLRAPDTSATTPIRLAAPIPGPSLAWRLTHLL